MEMIWIGKTIASLVIGIAVIMGLKYTKNANCLWALFFIALIWINR